jgi:hypothetical protein
MNAPQRMSPDRLPDPWLLDTESLLSELARIRELALRIPPVRNDVLGPINSVVDAVWDLEGRLRYCLHCIVRRNDPLHGVTIRTRLNDEIRRTNVTVIRK